MSAASTPTICLAMLVRDESAVIARCLESLRDRIDSWVIVDSGSSDDTETRARTALEGIPGEWHARPWRDFASNRNELLELSRPQADYLLCLDADETLESDTVEPWTGLDLQAYALEIRTPRGSFTPPRLLRADAPCRYVGAVAERLVGIDEVAVLDGVALAHHEDGVRWREPDRARRDIQILLGALLEAPRDPDLTLALAERFAQCGEAAPALHYYRERAGLEGDEAQTWYALYRIGGMLDELGYATSFAAQAYYDAFAFRPSKIEPLLRIAERCRQEGDPSMAADLARVAVETEAIDRDYFFEPEAYGRARYIESLEANAALAQFDEVESLAARLCAEEALAPAVLAEVEDIRARAAERAASASASSPPSDPNVESIAQRRLASERILAATPARQRRKLCIGMSTYDDYDGVYFSVQAIRLYHAEVADQIEILVIDNNPTGAGATALKALEDSIENYRYVPEADAVGSSVRDRIFGEANADFVMVMDCHVFLAPGALAKLIAYFDADPLTNDLLQGPLVYDDLTSLSTHFEPKWGSGMFGSWESDPRGLDPDAEPFDIPMQGLGLFACRKDAWPGFNKRLRGFGAEEGYIHEKVRQAGGRSLCLPFLVWMHRFNRPLGVPYPINWADRIRNYMIAWQEIGWDLAPIQTHFSEHIGETETNRVFAAVTDEIHSALFGFDGVYHLPGEAEESADEEDLDAQFRRLQISSVVVQVPLPTGHPNLACRRVMAYRSILERARKAQLRSVLVIERIEEMTAEAQEALRRCLETLPSGSAGSFVLPSKQPDAGGPLAVALHERLFERLLDRLPEQSGSVAQWLAENGSFEGFLAALAEN